MDPSRGALTGLCRLPRLQRTRRTSDGSRAEDKGRDEQRTEQHLSRGTCEKLKRSTEKSVVQHEDSRLNKHRKAQCGGMSCSELIITDVAAVVSQRPHARMPHGQRVASGEIWINPTPVDKTSEPLARREPTYLGRENSGAQGGCLPRYARESRS